MSKPTETPTPANPDCVNINDPAEVDGYWVGYFEASKQAIIDAVLEVGGKPGDVYTKLGKSHD
jgi:hypothetical protein